MNGFVVVVCDDEFHDHGPVDFQVFEIENGSIVMTDDRGRLILPVATLPILPDSFDLAGESEVPVGDRGQGVMFGPGVRWRFDRECSCGFKAEWRMEKLEPVLVKLATHRVPKISLKRLDALV